MTELVVVEVYKADSTIRAVPDLHLQIHVSQPKDETLDGGFERHYREAQRIAAALEAALPGGTMTALLGVLLQKSGDRHLRVPVFTR